MLEIPISGSLGPWYIAQLVFLLFCLSKIHYNFFSYGCFIIVCVFSHSVMSRSATLHTVAHQTALSMKFPRQEYWTQGSNLSILSTQGSNLHPLCLLHCRQILYPLSHQGIPPTLYKEEKHYFSLISWL